MKIQIVRVKNFRTLWDKIHKTINKTLEKFRDNLFSKLMSGEVKVAND